MSTKNNVIVVGLLILLSILFGFLLGKALQERERTMSYKNVEEIYNHLPKEDVAAIFIRGVAEGMKLKDKMSISKAWVMSYIDKMEFRNPYARIPIEAVKEMLNKWERYISGEDEEKKDTLW